MTTRRRRQSRWGTVLLLLPLLAGAGIFVGAHLSSSASRCANGFGCAGVRNAGPLPVTITAHDVDTIGTVTYTVRPGTRDPLLGYRNDILVPARSCLTIDQGPFWNQRTMVQSVTTPTTVSLDSWGARVILSAGSCPDRDQSR